MCVTITSTDSPTFVRGSVHGQIADLDKILDDYYVQEVGQTITTQ